MSRVFQIVTQMEAAGAQKVAYLLHQSLLSRGQSPELVFLYTKRPAYMGLPGVSSLLDHPPSATDYARICARLFRKLRQSKPDVVIAHTHYANILGLPIAAAAGVKKRIAVHHNPLPTYPAAARSADRVLGQIGAYTQMVAVSDTVVQTVENYPNRYKSLLTRIYNGLPKQTFDQADVYGRWPIHPDKPLIVNVGRLSRQKNHEALLRAMQQLPDVQLAILGAGELGEELRRLAQDLQVSDRVCFTGELPPAEVYSFLQAANVFVFPSLWESMGLAVVEAMQAGLPIVASDIPAMHEILGTSALLVPPQDASALAGAISQILNDPILAAALGTGARSRSQLFSVESMVSRYEELLCA
jgi:glycosyltransferase involved in cell wall biosynthesis